MKTYILNIFMTETNSHLLFVFVKKVSERLHKIKGVKHRCYGLLNIETIFQRLTLNLMELQSMASQKSIRPQISQYGLRIGENLVSLTIFFVLTLIANTLFAQNPANASIEDEPIRVIAPPAGYSHNLEGQLCFLYRNNPRCVVQDKLPAAVTAATAIGEFWFWGLDNGTILVLDSNTPRRYTFAKLPPFKITQMLYNPVDNSLIAADNDSLWECSSLDKERHECKEIVKLPRQYDLRINNFVSDENGSFYVATTHDYILKVKRISEGKYGYEKIYGSGSDKDSIFALKVINGKLYFSAFCSSSEKQPCLDIYTLNTGELVKIPLPGWYYNVKFITAIGYNPDSNNLILGTNNGLLIRYNIAQETISKTPMAVLSVTRTAHVSKIIYNQDGKYFIVGTVGKDSDNNDTGELVQIGTTGAFKDMVRLLIPHFSSIPFMYDSRFPSKGAKYEKALAIDKVTLSEDAKIQDCPEQIECPASKIRLTNKSSTPIDGMEICLSGKGTKIFSFTNGTNCEKDITIDKESSTDVTIYSKYSTENPEQLKLEVKYPPYSGAYPLNTLIIPVGNPPLLPGIPTTENINKHKLLHKTDKVSLNREMHIFWLDKTQPGPAVFKIDKLALEDIPGHLGEKKAFEIVDISEAPDIYKKYHLPQCTASMHPKQGQVNTLFSGGTEGACIELVKAIGETMAPSSSKSSDQANLNMTGKLIAPKTTITTIEKKVPLYQGLVLYVGGEFVQIDYNNGYLPANHLFKITGLDGVGGPTVNLVPGANFNNDVVALAESANGILYAGGLFTNDGFLGGVPFSPYISGYNGTNWIPVGGVNGSVRALTKQGNDIYVGGSFTTVGGQPANHIAIFDGENWIPLGTGVDNTVWALKKYNNMLYVGGSFTMAGGQPANRIAVFDGNNWAPLGAGFGNTVNALAILNGELFAAGIFTSSGGQPIGSVAQYNGANWITAGMPGGNDLIFALATVNNTLYVGGWFFIGGPQPLYNIARFDGGNWAALGAGLNSTVYTLASYNNVLYVGGAFTTADGIEAEQLAKYTPIDGWSSIIQDILMDGHVYVLLPVMEMGDAED